MAGVETGDLIIYDGMPPKPCSLQTLAVRAGKPELWGAVSAALAPSFPRLTAYNSVFAVFLFRI